MTEAPWRDASEAGRVVLAFDGIDAERRDDLEAKAFVKRLADPPREYGGMFARPKTDPIVAFLAVLGLLLGFSLSQAARALGLAGAIGVIAFFVGALVPTAVYAIHRLRGRNVLPRDYTDRFDVTIDARGFRATGARGSHAAFALEEIDHFAGGPRLVVVTRDGRKHPLPCALPLPGDHGLLARRLDEGLADVRASIGGYRGAPPPRVRVDVGADEASAEDDEGAAAVAGRAVTLDDRR